jgi:hypothetical protein
MPRSRDRNLTCPNGHNFEADQLATSDDEIVCPECGSQIAIVNVSPSSDSETPVAAKSLWDVMAHSSADAPAASDSAAESESQPTPDSAETDVDDVSFLATETAQEDQSEAHERPRGLWAMMGATDPETISESEPAKSDTEFSASSEDAPTGDDTDSYDDSDDDAEEGSHDDEEGDSDDGLTSEFDDEGESDDDFQLADDDEEDGWEVDSPLHDFDAADRSISSQDAPTDSLDQQGLPQGTGAVVAGILSVLLSGLNLLPSFAATIPATFAGAYALLLGYQTLGSNRRQRKSAPGLLAPVGMLLGLVGIFAGPGYLNQLGESWRNRSTREVIESNLGSINKALHDYAIEKGHFPAGGTFTIDEDGLEVGMHSWMTSLLPYLGHMEVYDEIDQSRAWNDNANAAPMSRQISTFLIPAVEHEPTGRGFATTHYAGVGGVIQTDQGLQSLGIFDKNSAVRVEHITDGNSQTIIAGEIATALPGWGDPENWRTIEGPLNQRLSSFGNAAGTGAHFLRADGSVRFYSNKTSPDVLQRLATRDADD